MMPLYFAEMFFNVYPFTFWMLYKHHKYSANKHQQNTENFLNALRNDLLLNVYQLT